MLEHLPSKAFWADISLDLESSQISEIQNKVASLITEQLECPKELRGFKKIRERSPAEYDCILEWIEACLNKVPQEFREIERCLGDCPIRTEKGRKRSSKSASRRCVKTNS